MCEGTRPPTHSLDSPFYLRTGGQAQGYTMAPLTRQGLSPPQGIDTDPASWGLPSREFSQLRVSFSFDHFSQWDCQWDSMGWWYCGVTGVVVWGSPPQSPSSGMTWLVQNPGLPLTGRDRATTLTTELLFPNKPWDGSD